MVKKAHGTIETILESKDSIENFVGSVFQKLLLFFSIQKKDVGKVEIVLANNPKVFAEFYEGSKKKRTPKELTDIYESVEAFYDEEKNVIVLPNFVRIGKNTFSNKKLYICAETLLHEIIHLIQYNIGGYSESYLFDEGTVEFITYSIAGGIDPSDLHDYFLYVKYIYTMLKNCGENLSDDDCLKWNKKYVLANNKEELGKKLIQKFIEHNKLKYSIDELHKILEDGELSKIKKISVFNDFSDEEMQNVLYALLEKYDIV